MVVVAVLLLPTSECATDELSAPDATTSLQPRSATGSRESPDQTAAGETLTGVVGDEAGPDAFAITLTDESGNQVSTPPAGAYKLQVNDLSTIHNFRLTGPGVQQATTVEKTGQVTWTVTLEAGDYTFQCAPHAGQMVDGFTVS